VGNATSDKLSKDCKRLAERKDKKKASQYSFQECETNTKQTSTFWQESTNKMQKNLQERVVMVHNFDFIRVPFRFGVQTI
jgi:mevalonate pyrophosphate decarboxylase